MKWWMGILVGVLMWQPVVMAQEEELVDPAVLNDPPQHYGTFKKVVDTLGPTAITGYDLVDGEWYHGVAGSLYNFKSREHHLASIKMGYLVDHKIVAGAEADLEGISRRYIPSAIKGVATRGYLDTLWRVVGTYGHIGFMAGYDFDDRVSDDDQLLLMLTIGGTIKF